MILSLFSLSEALSPAYLAENMPGSKLSPGTTSPESSDIEYFFDSLAPCLAFMRAFSRKELPSSTASSIPRSVNEKIL